jgi:hypothetical protein
VYHLFSAKVYHLFSAKVYHWFSAKGYQVAGTVVLRVDELAVFHREGGFLLWVEPPA